MAERRIGVVWLVNWLAETHCSPNHATQACIVVDERHAGQYVCAVNNIARDYGLRPDMRLADARALVPDLNITHFDPIQDQRRFRLCMDWAGRFTPWVGEMEVLTGRNLALDLTGCGHLFGGERKLAERIISALKKRGITARIAIANTPGAAWALAHYGAHSITILPTGQEHSAVLDLPVASLRLSPEMIALCRKLGFAKVKMLLALPRADIRRRLDAEILKRLEQALGDQGEAISPARPLPLFSCEKSLPQPVIELATLGHYLTPLVDSLCAKLRAAGRGAKRVDLRLTYTGNRYFGHAFYLAQPITHASHILRLLTDRLTQLQNQFDATLGVEEIVLSAPQTAPLGGVQASLDSLAPHQKHILGRAFFALCDRLGERLGHDHVLRLVPQASYIPEQAVQAIPSLQLEAVPTYDTAAPRERPIILLSHAEPIEVIADVPDGPPRRFRWRRRLYTVVKAQGPERLAPAWWQTGGAKQQRIRDYFRLEDDNGYRFWLYRDGLYDAAIKPPIWYMHGFFA